MVAGDRFSIKLLSCQYRNTHYKDKAVLYLLRIAIIISHDSSEVMIIGISKPWFMCYMYHIAVTGCLPHGAVLHVSHTVCCLLCGGVIGISPYCDWLFSTLCVYYMHHCAYTMDVRHIVYLTVSFLMYCSYYV